MTFGANGSVDLTTDDIRSWYLVSRAGQAGLIFLKSLMISQRRDYKALYDHSRV